MQEEIKAAWSQARSIESKSEWSQVEKIGAVECGQKQFVFYKDENGEYWYKTMFKQAEEWVSEFEHIFGKTRKGRAGTWREKSQ